MKKRVSKNNEEKITRKEAITKAGKYAAFTAAATLFLLNPKLSQAGSTTPAPPPPRRPAPKRDSPWD